MDPGSEKEEKTAGNRYFEQVRTRANYHWNEDKTLLPDLRRQFNEGFTKERYAALLRLMEERCGARVEYRIAETPVFLPSELLEEMAGAGTDLTRRLLE